MSASPYAVPLEEFLARWRIPASEQVEGYGPAGLTAGPDQGADHEPVDDGGAGADGG